MVTNDGYILSQEPNKNRIVITLPQTFGTANCTTSDMVNRKRFLTATEESVVLGVVRKLLEAEGDE